MPRYQEEKQEAQERLAAEIGRRRERGEPFRLLEVARKRGEVAGSFWGNAWCAHLEAWGDYQDRLPRGKAFLRRGTVYDLTLGPGEIFAYVTGAEIYEVLIRIDPIPEETWSRVRAACAGRIESLVDLLSGQLGPEVMRILAHPDEGLFPRAEELHFNCTCEDWANLCVHTAAVLFGTGVLLDEQPELLFTLRQANQAELLSEVLAEAASVPDDDATAEGATLRPEALAALFGIEIAEPETAFPDLRTP